MHNIWVPLIALVSHVLVRHYDHYMTFQGVFYVYAQREVRWQVACQRSLYIFRFGIIILCGGVK